MYLTTDPTVRVNSKPAAASAAGRASTSAGLYGGSAFWSVAHAEPICEPFTLASAPVTCTIASKRSLRGRNELDFLGDSFFAGSGRQEGSGDTSPVFSSLLFSSLVTLLSRLLRDIFVTSSVRLFLLRDKRLRSAASDLCLALSPLCRSKFGIVTPLDRTCSQPTADIASANPS